MATKSRPDRVVLYHGPNCKDGFAAAYAAWTVLGNEALYIPVQYGESPPPKAYFCNQLFILDFSYPRSVLLDLAERGVNVVVLDHHVTAEADLTGLEHEQIFVRFDIKKSGAVLAWEYFCDDLKVPLLLEYVQDRDLWQWELMRSREISAWLTTVPMDFPSWDREVLAFERDPQYRYKVSELGGSIITFQGKHIDQLTYLIHWVGIAGHRVPAVNSSVFQSEIGERLCRLHPSADFSAVFACIDQDIEVWSLRSSGEFDVSAVAKSYGGGGHRAAAGFKRYRGDSRVLAVRQVDTRDQG